MWLNDRMFVKLRILPVFVSRSPIEVIFLSALILSACYYYLIHYFPSSVLPSYDDHFSLYSSRYEYDGINKELTESTTEELNYPYFALKQFWYIGPRISISQPRGALTRRALKSLFHFQNSVEKITSVELMRVSPLDLWNNSLSVFSKDERYIDRIVKFSTSKKVTACISNLNSDEYGSYGASALVLSYFANITSNEVLQKYNEWVDTTTKIKNDFFTRSDLMKLKINREASLTNSLLSWFAAFTYGFLTIKDLLENSENLDLFIIVASYSLMHFTFYSLFRNMRKLGSRLTYGLMTLFGGLMAFLSSLVLGSYLGLQIK
jgi:hypothetical protein